MAAVVIKNEKLEKHSINKYNFKVIASSSEIPNDSHGEVITSLSSTEQQLYTQDDNPSRRASDIDSSAMTTSSKDALIESLMKKTDEMSSNFIKLQMKLEAKEEEYALGLQTTKESAFEEGVQAGIAQAEQSAAVNTSKGIEQFSTSVATLEVSAKEFETALENIKADLIIAAVDIAKEVINIELSDNSAEVAKVLGDSLIKELQSASKITLKVNPKDHGSISEHVGILEHIQVVSDSAVSEGGVIAMSDAGNVDAQISKRFQRVKKAALSE